MRCLGSRCTHPCRPAPAAQLTVHGAPHAAHSVQHAVQATLNITAACAVAVPPSGRAAVAHGHTGRNPPLRSIKRLPHSARKQNAACTPTARKHTRHAARNTNGPPGAKRRRKRRSRAAVDGGRSVFGLARRNLGYDEFSALDRVRCEKLVRLGRIEQLRVVAQLAAQHATWRSGQPNPKGDGAAISC